MDSLRYLFELNRDVILFAYGLVFFTLGLMIALQSRRYSRLDLARSLKCLAAFGFAHGLHEWGDMFIPLQATYLSDSAIQFWLVIQLLLLSISFAFLLDDRVPNQPHYQRWGLQSYTGPGIRCSQVCPDHR